MEKQDTNERKGTRVRFNFLRFFGSLKHYLNFHEEVEPEGTINSIKKDADLNGYNIYILIFSIFIASIGLNVGSTAVIIGAMLISPLMGPIMGMGLALGINDIKLLSRSLRNLGITVSFALLTSALYFWVSPIKDLNHELLARTQPTLLDALIAIFGGLAGIMASSRKEKNNAVPGVAIATALMPPLCTAGYGLSQGDVSIFLGAFYLFMLNSIFISLATVVVVRYVGFPKVSFVDPRRETKVKRYIASFVILILLPSGVIFYNVIQESLFQQRARVFIDKHIGNQEDLSVVNSNISFSRDSSVIEVFILGKPLEEDERRQLSNMLKNEGLQNTQLVFRQNETMDFTDQNLLLGNGTVLHEMLKESRKTADMQAGIIDSLTVQMQQSAEYQLNYSTLVAEIRIQYPELVSLRYAHWGVFMEDANRTFPPVFYTVWKKTLDRKTALGNNERLASWLSLRLRADTILVKSITED